MKAEELRIGNWYLGASRGNPLQATARFIQQLDEGLLNCSPIQLTPEILEKCGFNKQLVLGKLGVYWYEKHPLSYSESHQKWWKLGLASPQPKSLHQLQNLYYALCGEELTFKP